MNLVDGLIATLAIAGVSVVTALIANGVLYFFGMPGVVVLALVTLGVAPFVLGRE